MKEKKLLRLFSVGERSSIGYQYCCLAKYKNIFVLPPYNANELILVNAVGEILFKKRMSESKFNCNIFIRGALCYFWGNNAREIVAFNVENHDIEYINFENGDSVCGIDYVVQNNSLFLPIRKNNTLLEIDLVNRGIKKHIIKSDDLRKTFFCTICFDGTDFWLSGESNQITKWNKWKHDIQHFDIDVNLIDSNNCAEYKAAFFSSTFAGNCIYFSPSNSMDIICFDLDSFKSKQIIRIDENVFSLPIERWNDYYHWRIEREGVSLQNYIIKYDTLTEDNSLVTEYDIEDEIISESIGRPLKMFVRSIEDI